MIRAGTGISEVKDGIRAAREATQRALAQAGVEAADAVFVFATPDHTPRYEAMLEAIAAAAGTRIISGCSAVGVICDGREVEKGTAVVVLVAAGPGLKFEVGLLPEGAPSKELGTAMGHVALHAPPHAGRRARAPSTPPPASALMLFPALTGFDAGRFLEGLAGSAPGLPVLGAAPSGRGARASVFAGAEAAESRTCTAILRGGASLEVALAQGCRPIGRPVVITKVNGDTEIQDLASRPAAESLAAAMEAAGVDDSKAATHGVFAGLAINPVKHPLERGDFLVRPIAGIDAKTGAISIGDRVSVGKTLVFQLRDKEAATEDMEAVLDALVARLQGRAPRFGLYFNCSGRGKGLFGAPDHDAAAIRRRFPTLPLAGLFGNGELAPIGGKNLVHTFTGVLVLFLDA